MYYLCVVDLEPLVTVNDTKILSVEQKCFYVKFMSLARMQIICASF
jgi:hypothetical protein